MNYLLLTGLSHGKLVNVRSPSVQHEFVNSTLTLADRTAFAIDVSAWDSAALGASRLQTLIVALARDFGAGLSLPLYLEAIVHLMGGESAVLREVPIFRDCRQIGCELLPHVASDALFRLTALDDDSRPAFGNHLQRFLRHTPLEVVHWINIHLKTITFTTLHRDDALLSMAEKCGVKNGK